jgi:hypothetical protein
MTAITRKSLLTTKAETANDNSKPGKTTEPLKPPKIADCVLINCIVEACTEGERRALARGRLQEVAPHVFKLYPTSLCEICGPRIVWTSPAHGDAIDARISTLKEASEVLRWWGTVTVATCASLHR